MNTSRTHLIALVSTGTFCCLALKISSLSVVFRTFSYVLPTLVIGTALLIRTLNSEHRWSLPVFLAAAFVLGYPAAMLLVVPVMMIPGMQPYAHWFPPGTAVALLLIYLLKQKKISPSVFKRDATAWILIFSVVLLVYPPFSNVGKKVEKGYAYRAYFDHDTLVHLAVAAELSHGHMPPRNPYFARETLHYYWLPFLFPATIYRASGYTVSLEKCLVLLNFILAVCFTLLLYRFISAYMNHAASAGITTLLVLIATSLEGPFLLIRLLFKGKSLYDITHYNIDGLSRWIFGTPQIDSLYRGLLFTPQHLTALSLFCLVFWWLRSEHRHFPSQTVPITAAAALVTGCSAFIALIFFAGLAGFFIVSVMRSPGTRSAVIRRMIPIAVVTILILSLWIHLQMIVIGVQSPTFGSGTHRGLDLLWIFFLNLGWPTLLGIWGYILARRDGHRNLWELAVLGFLSLGFIFMFTLPEYENEFGLRGGFTFLTTTAPLAAYVIRHVFFTTGNTRYIAGVFLILMIVVTGLTTALDIYNLQDITNPRFTTIVPASFISPLKWLRTNTAQDMVIQSEPEIILDDNRSLPNFIPPFAERCMAVGKRYYAGQFQVGRDRAQKEIDRIQDVFNSPHAIDILEAQRDPGIDLWWIGPDEEKSYPPEALKKFNNRMITKCVYNGGGVKILEPTFEFLPKVMLHPENCWNNFEESTAVGPIDANQAEFIHPDAGETVSFDSVSGLETIERPEHDWIFSPADLLPGPVYLATRNPVLLTLDNITRQEPLLMKLFYIRCRGAPQQFIRVGCNEKPIGWLRLHPGWHWYAVPLQKSVSDRANQSVTVTLTARRFSAPRDLCHFDHDIGDTGIEAPSALLVRVGPAPNGGIFGDVFWKGKNLSPHKRGYNLVPIPPDIKPEVFDIESNPHEENTRMAQWISSLPDKTIVCGLTIGRCLPELNSEGKSALALLGVDMHIGFNPNDTHAFIGVKGTSPGDVPEVFTQDRPEFIFVGPNQGRRKFGFALADIRRINLP